MGVALDQLQYSDCYVCHKPVTNMELRAIIRKRGRLLMHFVDARVETHRLRPLCIDSARLSACVRS